tara:strand:- start:1946 stop:2305 length:360 start_codon:yes stop_codon:yes gene_type:complete
MHGIEEHNHVQAYWQDTVNFKYVDTLISNMISNDENHRFMTEQFNNIFSKMDRLHTETTESIEVLRREVDEIKLSHHSHVAVAEAMREVKQASALSNKQKIGIILGSIPVLVAIYSFTQ